MGRASVARVPGVTRRQRYRSRRMLLRLAQGGTQDQDKLIPSLGGILVMMTNMLQKLSLLQVRSCCDD